MQNYNNHTKYFPFHHFVVAPLSLGLLSWSIWNLAEAYARDLDTGLYLFLLLAAFLLFLIPILARIYALKNQNRIIRLEMRFRYFQLTGTSFLDLETKLTLGQLIALRFAGDGELVGLIEDAVAQKLTPKAIKQRIQNWQGDHCRV